MIKKFISALFTIALVISLYILNPSVSKAAPPVPTGLNGTCTTNTCNMTWTAVSGATSYNLYSSSTSGGMYTKLNLAGITTTTYANVGLTASTTIYYKVASVNSTGTSALSGAVSRATVLNFGSNVHIYDPTTAAATINSDVAAIFSAQETSEFGNGRYALLFKPGTYTGVNVKVGFYTQVSGLGQNPSGVNINNGGVNANADWSNGNALVNFWRSMENLTITPPAGTNAQWAVSQAAPVRRVHIKGTLELFDFDASWNAGTASGGFLADSKIDGGISSASQQQWLSRNNQYGSWSNGVWNQVFVGDTTPPAGVFPIIPYTVVAQTPIIREKPYLYMNTSGVYNVFVPNLRTNAQGISWSAGTTAGTSININQFHIVDSSSNADSINAALSKGKHLLFTPGIYHLNDTLRVTQANTVVLGLGYATLVPDTGLAAMTVADVDGVKIGGLLIQAGLVNSPVLLEVGPTGSSATHLSNPTSLHDVFVAVGGAINGRADVGVRINSSNVIGDHFWLWRADHGIGAGTWTSNPSKNGLIVNGLNVTIYGLFNEHFREHQTIWNGNGGRVYFYQSEIPYEVPNQASWMNGAVNGYASYKVANTVTTHEAWGVGVYSYFRDAAVKSNSGIEVPNVPGVKIHHATSIFLAGLGEITHVINNMGGTANITNIRQTIAEFAGGVGSDDQAPTVPTNLVATAVSGSQINLSWTASTDNVGVTGYNIYRYGTLLTTTTSTSYSHTALTASTSYSYSVRAKDAADNISAHSKTTSSITTPVPSALNSKKGLGSSKYVVNNTTQADFSKITNVGAAWTYNWSTAYYGTNNTSVEYVPMVWGPGAVTPATFTTIAQGKAAGKYKHLLTFNEPELYEQANMSVESAIGFWPSLMNTGLRLSSPAVALSATTYAYGQTWLENFMNAADANGYHVDFIAVHYYPDFMSPTVVNDLQVSLTALYDKYQKPIWITEIGNINVGQLSVTPTVQGAQTFVTNVVPMLESLSFVHRYAWFDDNCSNDPGCAFTTVYDAADNLTPVGTSYQASSTTKAPLFRFGWTATSNPTVSNGDVPANMFDNNMYTRFSTSAAQASGQYIIVDTKAIQTFSQIIMNSTGSGDYARGYQVFVSNDGTTWGSAIASGTGSTPIITVDFASQTARYIKVVQTGAAPANYWSIHELDVCN